MYCKPIPTATPELLTKFVKSYLPIDGCWYWQEHKTKGGYGSFDINDALYLAHRVSWTWWNGSIPLDLVVCHSCDNRACVNPEHLMIGPQSANVMDTKRKHRKRWANFSLRSPKI